jgi:ketosteroid isomerase-like protein
VGFASLDALMSFLRRECVAGPGEDQGRPWEWREEVMRKETRIRSIEMVIQPRRRLRIHTKEGEMKSRTLILMVLALMFTVPAALYAQDTDPEAAINAAVDAWNAGDVATLKALYADGAVLCFPDWGDDCATVPAQSAEELGAWIEELVAANFVIEPQSLEAKGDTVTLVAKVWADPTRALGIAPLVTTDAYTVQDGMIIRQTSTLDEESAAKLTAAMASMEPETMPETGGGAFPVPGALLALGGFAVLAGLSRLQRTLSGHGR